MLQAILLPLITIIGLVNLLGGIVGGIWLLFKGEWISVLIAVVLLIMGGTFLISLLLLPSLGLGFLTAALVERKKYLAGGGSEYYFACIHGGYYGSVGLSFYGILHK
jgi:hypothetical protein